MIHVFNSRALPAFLLLSLAACSKPSAVSPQPSPQLQTEFSAQDKVIAQALSVGEKVSAGESPQFQAVVCSLALKTVQPQIENSGALSAEQQRGFEQALRLFANRAASGLSVAELNQNRVRAEETYPDVNERARIAIGCLRDII